MKNKTDLRAKLKEARKTFDILTASNIIAGKIQNHQAFKTAKNIMLYYPLKYEINLLSLIDEKKNFYFPKVNDKKLLVCPNCNEFEQSCLKINEPCSNPVDPSVLDLIIVPALAVDLKNIRLGYGGGFYDRFLAENNNILTLTPIFKECVFKSLPHEEFDIPVDFVVTD